MNEKRRAELLEQMAAMSERDRELGRQVTELLADCRSWQEQDKVLEWVLRILMASSPEGGAADYPALARNLGVVLDRALPDELVEELVKNLHPDEKEPEGEAGGERWVTTGYRVATNPAPLAGAGTEKPVWGVWISLRPSGTPPSEPEDCLWPVKAATAAVAQERVARKLAEMVAGTAAKVLDWLRGKLARDQAAQGQKGGVVGRALEETGSKLLENFELPEEGAAVVRGGAAGSEQTDYGTITLYFSTGREPVGERPLEPGGPPLPVWRVNIACPIVDHLRVLGVPAPTAVAAQERIVAHYGELLADVPGLQWELPAEQPADEEDEEEQG